MQTELIISTYNSPRALTLTLTSVACQDVRPDSDLHRRRRLRARDRRRDRGLRRGASRPALRHVWHEDRGFEKSAILNKAIATSEAEFLVFIDGDVMIHPCFVARHLEIARPDRFSSGSLIRLGARGDRGGHARGYPSRGGCSTGPGCASGGRSTGFGTWLKTMPFPKPVMAALDRLTPVQKALVRRQRLGLSAPPCWR